MSGVSAWPSYIYIYQCTLPLCAVPYMLCRHVLVVVTTERNSVTLSMMLSSSERTLLGFFMIVSAWVINKDTLGVCPVGCREWDPIICIYVCMCAQSIQCTPLCVYPYIFRSRMCHCLGADAHKRMSYQDILM